MNDVENRFIYDQSIIFFEAENMSAVGRRLITQNMTLMRTITNYDNNEGKCNFRFI